MLVWFSLFVCLYNQFLYLSLLILSLSQFSFSALSCIRFGLTNSPSLHLYLENFRSIFSSFLTLLLLIVLPLSSFSFLLSLLVPRIIRRIFASCLHIFFISLISFWFTTDLFPSPSLTIPHTSPHARAHYLSRLTSLKYARTTCIRVGKKGLFRLCSDVIKMRADDGTHRHTHTRAAAHKEAT